MVYDLVGIGFGPANIAIDIFCESLGIEDVIFLDRKSEFSWHPGMLLDTSQLQISFLKDLVSIEDPTSKYTFVNYLKLNNRLNEFINLRKFYPDRIEFAQYYEWVAKQFKNVKYNSNVEKIIYTSILDEEIIEITYKDTNTNQTFTIHTRNLVIADGGTKNIPINVIESQNVFHTDSALTSLERNFPNYRDDRHIAVIGSGQSAVDVLTYLFTRYPNLKISSFIRKFAFKPQDDSHFVNELFFPENSLLWYHLDDDLKKELFELHKDVTHSAADIEMLPPLYNMIYMDKATNKNRFSLYRFHELIATKDNEKVDALFYDRFLKTEVWKKFDSIILATGYKHNIPHPLLENINNFLLHENKYIFDKDYSLIPNNKIFKPKVYLLGYAEESHGFSETLASLMATRAKKITTSIKESLR